MRCDTCNREENLIKKTMISTRESDKIITHHECDEDHKWHVLIAGDDTQILACNCPD